MTESRRQKTTKICLARYIIYVVYSTGTEQSYLINTTKFSFYQRWIFVFSVPEEDPRFLYLSSGHTWLGTILRMSLHLMFSFRIQGFTKSGWAVILTEVS